MLLNSFLSAVLQVGIFIGIGLLAYLIYYRKKYTFAEFYGLLPLQKGWGMSLLKLALAMVPYIAINVYIIKNLGLELAGDIRIQSFESTGWSFQTLAIIFIQSLIQTSFTEEISFRGYLINFFKKEKLGFWTGNIIQTALFVFIHWLACRHYPISIQIGVVISLTLMCLIWGYINHKEQKGSVLLTWFLHGLVNFITGFVAIHFFA